VFESAMKTADVTFQVTWIRLRFRLHRCEPLLRFRPHQKLIARCDDGKAPTSYIATPPRANAPGLRSLRS